jgi:hypothetical protein
MENYLDKLKKVVVGSTVYIKSVYSEPLPAKIVELEGSIATLDCNGNDDIPWKFSIKTSDALTPPYAYWISTEKGNNP